MILAALLAACQDVLGQNPDRIRIFKRVFAQDWPRNPGKCTTVRISRPEGAEIMSGQTFPSNKTGTLVEGTAWWGGGRWVLRCKRGGGPPSG